MLTLNVQTVCDANQSRRDGSERHKQSTCDRLDGCVGVFGVLAVLESGNEVGLPCS